MTVNSCKIQHGIRAHAMIEPFAQALEGSEVLSLSNEEVWKSPS